VHHDEHAGYYVCIQQNQIRELREYLNEIRIPYFVSPPELQDLIPPGKEELILFGSGVKESVLVEVLSIFDDGDAEGTLLKSSPTTMTAGRNCQQ
jgi:hypothetical protein